MKTFAIIGYGQRGVIYGRYAVKSGKIAAVCDANPERLKIAKQDFNLPDEMLFMNEDDFFSKGKIADYLFVTVQDKLHYRISIKALKAGYDLLLEKPIAASLNDCLEIEKTALALGRKIVVCHVLRYTGFYKKLKEILEQKPIGKIISIEQIENVGYWHMAHSYVRGNWGNEARSNPMILAKCCHDLDIIQYIAGSNCEKVWSNGQLNYFKKENAPEGSADRCVNGCAVERQCPYSAKRIYIDNLQKIPSSFRANAWPFTALSDDGIASLPKLEKAIKQGPYGKCVFKTDNDVVDHQVVQMLFGNGINATLTMTAFSKEIYRHIIIRGSDGEICGNFEDNKIIIKPFNSKKAKVIRTKTQKGGHGGGDAGIMADLINDNSNSSISNSIMSHVMAFAAEKSRKNNGTGVDLKEFVNETQSKK